MIYFLHSDDGGFLKLPELIKYELFWGPPKGVSRPEFLMWVDESTFLILLIRSFTLFSHSLGANYDPRRASFVRIAGLFAGFAKWYLLVGVTIYSLPRRPRVLLEDISAGFVEIVFFLPRWVMSSPFTNFQPTKIAVDSYGDKSNIGFYVLLCVALTAWLIQWRCANSIRKAVWETCFACISAFVGKSQCPVCKASMIGSELITNKVTCRYCANSVTSEELDLDIAYLSLHPLASEYSDLDGVFPEVRPTKKRIVLLTVGTLLTWIAMRYFAWSMGLL